MYMGAFCLHVCLCTKCELGACEGHKRASDPLALEIQMVVSPQVGAGD